MTPILVLGPALLALVHVVAGHLSLRKAFRPIWISFAGGVAIAYVFIHILPVLYRFATLVTDSETSLARSEWIFALALLGTCAYFAVEALFARQAGDTQVEHPIADRRAIADFAIHIGAFSVYNFLIGYLLADYPSESFLDIIATYGALGLHFAVVDADLRGHHKALYDRFGRWIMAIAVIVGGLAGSLDLITDPVMASGFAFLAGGMILNVFKEELPSQSTGRLLPFLAGASLFGILFVLA